MLSEFEKQLLKAARAGDLDAVNVTLAAGAAVNARGDYREAALNLAAEYGHLAIVQRLLAAGADADNLGGADKTPLTLAPGASAGVNAAFAWQLSVAPVFG